MDGPVNRTLVARRPSACAGPLIDLVRKRQINAWLVFDLLPDLPADRCRVMDQRQTIRVLLQP